MARFSSLMAASGLAALVALAAARADPGIAASRAVIAPAKTSIYLGSVTLAVDPLIREGSTYASDYTATVFPFFFCNEQGKFRIQVSESALRQLARGQAIDFTGEAVRDDGVVRVLQGHAVPSSVANEGEVKIRVHLSRHIVLVFNTHYRLIAGIK
jgi:hypothetical protein